ncbi:MAG: adenylosuccinate lyase [Acidimicrobiia bacterium]|nr:adenylosuccinate lyase [Acidimicrobiia bacterium]
MTVPNVLATRYASPEMGEIWSETRKAESQRRLWLAVMEAQRKLGVDIPETAIEAYRGAVDRVDLAAILERERVLRHDVKAALEEFNSVAGYEYAHLGMTSRDVTENVEQWQILNSLRLVRDRVVAALSRLGALATTYDGVAVTARTHNIPAQLTSLGKRFAMFGEELVLAFHNLEALLASYPLRGIKGPVGTQQDQLALLVSAEKVAELERMVAGHLGFEAVLGAVGQVYPRSLDFRVVSVLAETASAPMNLTNTLRLMAGHELASEGFAANQVGSSAMPHKMNARSSERVHGLGVVLRGHVTMASSLVGEQWNEGDVSCSVVRRVVLPDSFFAIDGLFQTFLTVLDEIGFASEIIASEVTDQLPYLATTALLVDAVKRGMGREHAHEIIRKHTVAALEAHRGGEKSDVVASLGGDNAFPLSSQDIEKILANPLTFTGLADRQVEEFVATVGEIVKAHPQAGSYTPGEIL